MIEAKIIIGYDWVRNLHSGDAQRIRAWISAIKEIQGSVEVIFPTQKSNLELKLADLSNEFKNVEFRAFAIDHRKILFQRIYMNFESLFKGVPTWILKQQSEEMKDYLKEIERNGKILLFLGEASANYFSDINFYSLTFWDKFDLVAASSRTFASYNLGIFESFKIRFHNLIGRRFERNNISKFSQVILCSTIEFDLAKKYFPNSKNLSVLESPCTKLAKIGWDYYSKRLGWFGSFSYSANYLGLLRFLGETNEIFYENDYSIEVYGSGLSNQMIEDLAQFSCAKVIGFVENLEDHLLGLKAVVIPIWSGSRGIKMKTLECISLGIPFLGTEMALDGISSECAAFISNESIELANKAINIEFSDIEKALNFTFKIREQLYSQKAFTQKILKFMNS